MRKQPSLSLATAYSAEPAFQHTLWYAKWSAKFNVL